MVMNHFPWPQKLGPGTVYKISFGYLHQGSPIPRSWPTSTSKHACTPHKWSCVRLPLTKNHPLFPPPCRATLLETTDLYFIYIRKKSVSRAAYPWRLWICFLWTFLRRGHLMDDLNVLWKSGGTKLSLCSTSSL